jgi:CDP-diacylglycerol--glycerol-3-phosphate 3-phosphatidyltransferase
VKRISRREFWNLPNSLTVARCVAVPFVALILVFPGPNWCAAATMVFVIASLTDLIDGYLARKLDLESTIGAFLDPLADKLLVMAVMVMLIPLDRIPSWIVVIFLAREITITALRGIAAAEGVIIKARSLGKYKTVFQITALSFLIYHYEILGADAHSVGIVLMWFALAYSMISAYDYLRGFLREAVV